MSTVGATQKRMSHETMGAQENMAPAVAGHDSEGLTRHFEAPKEGLLPMLEHPSTHRHPHQRVM